MCIFCQGAMCLRQAVDVIPVLSPVLTVHLHCTGPGDIVLRLHGGLLLKYLILKTSLCLYTPVSLSVDSLGWRELLNWDYLPIYRSKSPDPVTILVRSVLLKPSSLTLLLSQVHLGQIVQECVQLCFGCWHSCSIQSRFSLTASLKV